MIHQILNQQSLNPIQAMITMMREQPQFVPPKITDAQPPPVTSLNVNTSSCAASATEDSTKP
eukprot:2134283-Amphidinium_carterae.2